MGVVSWCAFFLIGLKLWAWDGKAEPVYNVFSAENLVGSKVTSNIAQIDAGLAFSIMSEISNCLSEQCWMEVPLDIGIGSVAIAKDTTIELTRNWKHRLWIRTEIGSMACFLIDMTNSKWNRYGSESSIQDISINSTRHLRKSAVYLLDECFHFQTPPVTITQIHTHHAST